MVDSSGLRFYYTATPPAQRAGILFLGHAVTPSMVVPPPHCAHCHLPSLAAHVLFSQPPSSSSSSSSSSFPSQRQQLVSAAYHALLNRTPADMQRCREMSIFSKSHRPLTVPVHFTRLLYAQFLQLRFAAPKNVGFAAPASLQQLRVRDLGMKLVSFAHTLQ